MWERYLLQVLAVVVTGDNIARRIFPPLYEKRFDQTIARFVNAVIIGYAILIIPMTFVGILLDGYLYMVVYGHYAIGLTFVLIDAIRLLRELRKIDPELILNTYKQELLLTPITLLLFGYLFISIIYPFRGWDALQFYLPNGYYFYLVDDIPNGVNPFSFFPTFKPPLNTLYITYNFYVTQTIDPIYANLHPYVFLLGSAGLVYLFIKDITDSRQYSLLGVFILLTMPITYFMIYEYAYYQDLPMMLFYASSVYYLQKVSDDKLFVIPTSLSISLAILSKMSGYSLIIVIPFLLYLGGRYRYLQMVGLTGLSVFLIRKVIYSTYVWMGAVVGLVTIFLLIHLYYSREKDEKLFYKFSSLVFPLIIGVGWLYFMLSIPNIDEFLLNQYVRRKSNTIIYSFVGLNPFGIYLENGMSVSFISSTFYILLGTLLGPIYWMLKLPTTLKSEDKAIGVHFRWIFLFFSIWFSYFGTVSGRYLTPIVIPIIVLITCNIRKILHHTGLQLKSPAVITSLSVLFASNYLVLVPVIPLRFVLDPTNLRFYNFHNNYLLIVTYSIIIWIFVKKVMIFLISIDQENALKISRVVLIIVALLPFIPQYGMIFYTGFDSSKFQESMNYYSRPEYQELITEINELELENDEKILSVNTPGLGYYTFQSVIDLMVGTRGAEDFPIYTENVTKALNLVEDLNIKLIIALNSSHVYYEGFVSNFAYLAMFKIIHDNKEFDLTFYNSEYKIFEKL